MKISFIIRRILIYGLGKSGLSTYKFLKKYSEIYLYDDKKNKGKSLEIKKRIISLKELIKKKIEYIIISPGININQCHLSKFLKKI